MNAYHQKSVSVINKTIRIGSRKSPLALKQVVECLKYIKNIYNTPVTFKQVHLESFGDKHKSISLLNEKVSEDFFTKELDEALLAGTIDIAVHSAKDLPFPLPEGLHLLALTKAFDKSDSIVTHNNIAFIDLPERATVGTSSIRRKKQLLELRPDLNIYSIRGTIEERLAYIQDGHCDGVIVATCALIRLALPQINWEKLRIQTHELQGHLALICQKDRIPEFSNISAIDIRINWGKVSLTGFGPASGEYMTLRGHDLCSQADIILYDKLIDEQYIQKYKAEKIFCGKESGHHHKTQDQINRLLFDLTLQGKSVVRLKGGDPFIFGRGGEELLFLKRNYIEVEIVPGIPAALLAASRFELPLTLRGQARSLAFVSGHNIEDFNPPAADTLVVYMGAARLPEIAGILIQRGYNPDLPSAVIRKAGWPDESRTDYTLSDLSISKEHFLSPLLLFVGHSINAIPGWQKEKGFTKALFTGSRIINAEHNRLHKDRILPFHRAFIDLRLVSDNPLLNLDFKDKNWILFTSVFAVTAFKNKLLELGKDVRFLSELKIACIGKTTAEELLKQLSLKADFISGKETSKDLVIEFSNMYKNKQYILHPTSNLSLPFLQQGFEDNGHDFSRVCLYTNRAPKNIDISDIDSFDEVHFASPSAIRNYVSAGGKKNMVKKTVCIGRTTQEVWDETT